MKLFKVSPAQSNFKKGGETNAQLPTAWEKNDSKKMFCHSKGGTPKRKNFVTLSGDETERSFISVFVTIHPDETCSFWADTIRTANSSSEKRFSRPTLYEQQTEFLEPQDHIQEVLFKRISEGFRHPLR